MDLTLIRELQTNARQRSSDIAKRLAVDTSTVSRRVQKLLSEGIIRIVTEADPFALGYKAVASIGMRFDPTKLDDAAEAVASYRAVHTLSVVTGRYDLLAWVVFREMGELQHFLTKEVGKIPGLKEMETMMNLKVVKRSYAFLTDNNK